MQVHELQRRFAVAESCSANRRLRFRLLDGMSETIGILRALGCATMHKTHTYSVEQTKASGLRARYCNCQSIPGLAVFIRTTIRAGA